MTIMYKDQIITEATSLFETYALPKADCIRLAIESTIENIADDITYTYNIEPEDAFVMALEAVSNEYSENLSAALEAEAASAAPATKREAIAAKAKELTERAKATAGNVAKNVNVTLAGKKIDKKYLTGKATELKKKATAIASKSDVVVTGKDGKQYSLKEALSKIRSTVKSKLSGLKDKIKILNDRLKAKINSASKATEATDTGEVIDLEKTLILTEDEKNTLELSLDVMNTCWAVMSPSVRNGTIQSLIIAMREPGAIHTISLSGLIGKMPKGLKEEWNRSAKSVMATRGAAAVSNTTKPSTSDPDMYQRQTMLAHRHGYNTAESMYSDYQSHGYIIVL